MKVSVIRYEEEIEIEETDSADNQDTDSGKGFLTTSWRESQLLQW